MIFKTLIVNQMTPVGCVCVCVRVCISVLCISFNDIQTIYIILSEKEKLMFLVHVIFIPFHPPSNPVKSYHQYKMGK